MPLKNGLTLKQDKFINEYLKSGNATQAAIKAGYNKNTAYAIGSENLKKLEKHIQTRVKQRDKRKVAQVDEVLELLTKFARGQAKEEQIVVEGTGDGCSKASIMKRKIANKDQITALDKLAKIHGLYTERVNINANVNGNVMVETISALKGRSLEDDNVSEVNEEENE
jgi:phage terminase small subunit